MLNTIIACILLQVIEHNQRRSVGKRIRLIFGCRSNE